MELVIIGVLLLTLCVQHVTHTKQVGSLLERVDSAPNLELRAQAPAPKPALAERKYIADTDDKGWNDFKGVADAEEDD